MKEEEGLYSAPAEEDGKESPEAPHGLSELEIEKTARRYETGDGVKKDLDKALRWYEKSRSSLARYASAMIYEEKEDYKKAEQELLNGLEAEDDDAIVFIQLELGNLYLNGRASGTPDYDSAIRYLEAGLAGEPAYGKLYAGHLGLAYEKAGRKIQAIHWYRSAVQDFGREEYRANLYRLYLTGVAGAQMKRLAEEALGKGVR